MCSDDLRELMSRFPTGVAVVTTVDLKGRPHGMTCSSLTSVCLSPPTLLVCLRTLSATFDAAQARGEFAVNVLEERGRMVAELFSSPESNRFANVAWELSPSGLPWLTENFAARADCKIVQTQAMGDHTVVFGQLRHLDTCDGRPLLHGMRRFFKAAPDALDILR